MINDYNSVAKRPDGPSRGAIGKNMSMLMTVYNVNPTCISRDVFVSNLYIILILGCVRMRRRYIKVLLREIFVMPEIGYASLTYYLKKISILLLILYVLCT